MRFEDLSPRQQQILLLEASGITASKEIGQVLGISSSWVRNQCTKIHKKMIDAGDLEYDSMRNKQVFCLRWLWSQGIAIPAPAEHPQDLYTDWYDENVERNRIAAMATIIAQAWQEEKAA